MPGNLLRGNRKSLYQFQDIFGDDHPHLVIFVGQGSDLHGGELAEIGIVKTDDADVLRDPQIFIGKFFDQPVGDLIIVADDSGGTV